MAGPGILFTEDESLAPLDGGKSLSLAGVAFKLQSNLFGGLGFPPEDGLGLASVSLLLGVISSLSLSKQRILSFLVL
jgi:hypothetical protein